MVRTFQLTKALCRMTVHRQHAARARQGQPGENLAQVAVRAALARAGAARSRRKADDLLERFKLHEKRDDFAGTLSGGQRKLLEMARALMGEPELVMLDEPMAGVNPALTQSLLGHVKSPARRGHDRAVRRARHGHGPRHLRLGRRDGRGPGHRRGPAGHGHGRPARSSTPTSARTTTPTSGDDALLSDDDDGADRRRRSPSRGGRARGRAGR